MNCNTYSGFLMLWINLEHQIDREEDYDLYNDVKMHKKPQLPQTIKQTEFWMNRSMQYHVQERRQTTGQYLTRTSL